MKFLQGRDSYKEAVQNVYTNPGNVEVCVYW